MAYVSYLFLFFVAVSVTVYYAVPIKLRPKILLLSSILFYFFSGTDNTVFLTIVILLTFFTGLIMEKAQSHRKTILAVYLVLSVGSLLFLKFIHSFLNLSSAFFGFHCISLPIIMPLGISFFMLQAMGYVIDIYRGKYESEKRFTDFALFMSFFPIIVQGPISRYDQLTESLCVGHKFDYKNFKFGVQLAVWGLFKKLVIANRAALYADPVFSNYTEYSGLSIIFAVLFYALQIYADFSGCVDICRGISQIFGVELINNFNHPYFSVSIQDFWRRWHISLSSWLRDYVYFPLGGNRSGKIRKYVNLIATFFVSGLWHGAGFHYLIWGMYHAVLQIVGDITRKPKEKLFGLLKVNTSVFSFKFGKQIVTFLLIAYSWLLFRAPGTVAAIKMTLGIFRDFIDPNQLQTLLGDGKDLFVLFIATFLLLLVSLMQEKISIREKLAEQNLYFRWSVYLLLVFSVIIFGVYGEQFNAADFLYMQF